MGLRILEGIDEGKVAGNLLECWRLEEDVRCGPGF